MNSEQEYIPIIKEIFDFLRTKNQVNLHISIEEVRMMMPQVSLMDLRDSYFYTYEDHNAAVLTSVEGTQWCYTQNQISKEIKFILDPDRNQVIELIFNQLIRKIDNEITPYFAIGRSRILEIKNCSEINIESNTLKLNIAFFCGLRNTEPQVVEIPILELIRALKYVYKN